MKSSCASVKPWLHGVRWKFGRIPKSNVPAKIPNKQFKSHINDKILYLVLTGSLDKILVPEVLHEMPMTMRDVVNNIFDVLLTGVLTEEGQKEYYKK